MLTITNLHTERHRVLAQMDVLDVSDLFSNTDKDIMQEAYCKILNIIDQTIENKAYNCIVYDAELVQNL